MSTDEPTGDGQVGQDQADAFRGGLPLREIAKHTGLPRNTIRRQGGVVGTSRTSHSAEAGPRDFHHLACSLNYLFKRKASDSTRLQPAAMSTTAPQALTSARS